MDLNALGGWLPLLEAETQTPYFAQLCEKVDAAYGSGTVYPPREQLFAAFALTPPEAVRCVILGQDPYHEPGQAMGLAFSVPEGTALPPSLRNILKERAEDLRVPKCGGELTDWAEQGVLLLNTVLSVSAGAANSHKDFGWQVFTDAVVAAIANLRQPIAFVLWGKQAEKKRALIEASPYPRLVHCAPHPSPLSSYRGFFGSKPFSQINVFLKENGEREINW